MREQQINETKNATKWKLNTLDDEKICAIEEIDANLTTLELRYRFFEKPHGFEEGRKNKHKKR